MQQLDAADLRLPLLVAAAATVLALVMPTAAVLAAQGRLPAAKPVTLIAGTVRLVAQHRWHDPASAYHGAVAQQMPEAGLWWLSASGAVAALLMVAGLIWRRVEPAMARERLGRRSYDLRGSRPRAWARPRDLRGLSGRGGADRGFSLGTIDGRRLRTGREDHVALIAPTRAGKTTRFVIPWLLEHDGPAIVTSTKRDVLDVTRGWRSRLGTVWVYDPFNPDTCAWDPLDGCRSWSHALRQSTWLADATQQGDSEIASYWRGEAAKLLAPLLHAAALDDQPIAAVLSWLDTQDTEAPAELLAAAHASAAMRQLIGTARLDERNRGTTFMSASSVLAAYRYPELNRNTGTPLTTAAFFDGRPNTLYVVAADRHQQLLTPLITTILSALLHETAEHFAGSASTTPTLRVLLDEAANIAPLRALPRHLSQAAGHGVRIATVWQTLAQLDERYGLSAATILANSATRVLMGPITDEPTQRLVRRSLDRRRREEQLSADDLAPNVTAGAQQLTKGRALVFTADCPPVVLETRPWWRMPRTRRRANRAVAS